MANVAPGAERIADTAGDAAPVVPPRAGARLGRWLGPAVFVFVAALLFSAYLGLSRTFQENSDEANILLMAWDMLHGNYFLHGWFTSDVPFITTELPQIALLERVFGLSLETSHIAAAMTFTLVVAVGALLAKGRTTGREAVLRMVLAAAIMFAPQPGTGVFVLVLSVGHIGTAVPVMVTWLVLDLGGRRTWVPPVVAVLLAWSLAADPLVVVVAILPLLAVCLSRIGTGIATTRGSPRARIAGALRARWFEVSLMAAAGVGWFLAWVAGRVIIDSGGYTQKAVPFQLTPNSLWFWHARVALSGLLSLFGADFVGQTGRTGALTALHLVGLTLAFWGMLAIARRFFFRDADLISQLLAVAVVANLAAYIPSTLANATALNAREFAPVLPFAAVVAGRMLGGRLLATRFRVRVLIPALAVMIAGYGYTLASGARQAPAQLRFAPVVKFLEAHHLRYGLSGYWQSSIITVETGGAITVRAVESCSLQPYQWEAKTSWYDSRENWADFLLIDTKNNGYETSFNPNGNALAALNTLNGSNDKLWGYGPMHPNMHGVLINLYAARIYRKNLLALIKDHRYLPSNPHACHLPK